MTGGAHDRGISETEYTHAARLEFQVIIECFDQIPVWLLLRHDAKALAAPARRTSW
jgi:hypothetical protein